MDNKYKFLQMMIEGINESREYFYKNKVSGDGKIVTNVPHSKHESYGDCCGAMDYSKVLRLYEYMRENNIDELDFSFDLKEEK